MIRFLEKVFFNIERSLKNTVIAFRIYGIIFSFCVITFGFLGILPLSRIIKTKLAISKEMQTSYKTLQTNLVTAQQAEKDILENKQRIALLDEYMPQETKVQTYILDFVESIGASGYVLSSFSQETPENTSGQIDLALSLEGVTYPTDMIKNIEVLKRVTQVKSVKISQNDKGMLNVNLLLTIYTLVI